MFESNAITVVIDPEIDNKAVVEKAIAMALVSRAKLEIIYSEYVHYLEDGYFYDPVVAKSLREEHSEVNAKKADALAQDYCSRNIEFSNDSTNLKLPHISIENRLFVLMPLSEINSAWKNPRSGKHISQLIAKISKFKDNKITKL